MRLNHVLNNKYTRIRVLYMKIRKISSADFLGMAVKIDWHLWAVNRFFGRQKRTLLIYNKCQMVQVMSVCTLKWNENMSTDIPTFFLLHKSYIITNGRTNPFW